jgi:sulfide-dependent adenosine diphosphate thiazole synthase
MLNEATITRAILDTYFQKLKNALDIDVAIVGGGPSGLVCGYYLAKSGKKVAMFERKLAVGGGMWGGGMMFNEIVIQDAAKTIIDEFDMNAEKYEEGYYTIDAVEAVSTLIYKSVKAGLKIFNLVSMEDVVFKNGTVGGLVINWTPVELNKLHVDPLTIHSKCVLDATGHPAEVVGVLLRKMGVKLDTPTGEMLGEKSMDAELGEMHTVENTRECFPGLFVSGMAANAVYGGYRMGPIFGGMLLSGQKAAVSILEKL